jgi:hypothetical protein
MESWRSARLPQGRYRPDVTVALESGAKGAGDHACTVIP